MPLVVLYKERPAVLRKIFALGLGLLGLALLAGCGGGEPATQNGGAQPKSGQQDVPNMGASVVEVPSAVMGRWSGVVLFIEDKKTGSSGEYTVPIGSTMKVPDSDLRIIVREFLPAFAMQGSTITSLSNEPNNPAAFVSVNEGGNEIFAGWLFSRYPTTHAFSHPRFTITLKEGVPKRQKGQ